MAGTLVRQKNRGRGFKPSNKKKKKKGGKGSTQANTQSIVNKVYMYPMRGARQNPKSLGKSNVNIIRQQIPIPVPGIPQGATPTSRHQKAVARVQYIADLQKQERMFGNFAKQLSSLNSSSNASERRVTEAEKSLRNLQAATASASEVNQLIGADKTAVGNTEARATATESAVNRLIGVDDWTDSDDDGTPVKDEAPLTLDDLNTTGNKGESSLAAGPATVDESPDRTSGSIVQGLRSLVGTASRKLESSLRGAETTPGEREEELLRSV